VCVCVCVCVTCVRRACASESAGDYWRFTPCRYLSCIPGQWYQ